MHGQPIRSADDLATALDRLGEVDPALVPLIGRARPLPLRDAEPGFASLARIVVAQQVSARVADVLFSRLKAEIEPLTPAGYLAAGPEAWRAAGLSRPKQKTLAALSEAVLAGALDPVALCDLDAEEAIARMTAVWGVGRWTAEVYLLFVAGHADIFPARDLALAAAVADHVGLGARPGETELAAIAESWRPLRSVAARLFWAIYGLDRGLPPPMPSGAIEK